MNKPTKIILHKRSKVLSLEFGEDHQDLSAEFLRVHSPSAEVTHHGKPELQVGKKDVGIDTIEPVGRYGIKICFTDGHDTGIFTWPYLTRLCNEKDTLWEDYLSALHQANQSRTPDASVVTLKHV